MEAIGLLALKSVCYGVLIALGLFLIGIIRKYNIQEEVLTLVTAAEMVFLGEGRGKEKKEWVLNQLVKKFPFLKRDKLEAIIERFVYQVTK